MMSRSSVDVPAEAAVPGVDLFAQARKALSVSSPFDPEESAPRVPTLPSGLASFLLRGPDSHRNHKKSHGEPAEKPSGHGKSPTVWDVTEEFFRPVTLADIDLLGPKLPLCPGLLDSCFTMPVFDNGVEDDKKDTKSDTCAAELSSITFPKKEEVILGQQIEEVEKVQAAEELPPMEIDEVVTSVGDSIPMQAVGDDDNLSLHWLLGSKNRLVLSAECPDKKRKLLDGDAGLDRLLLLPRSHTGVDPCDFCCSIEDRVKKNKLLRCHSCKVVVHQRCYGVHEVPEGVWLCAWCKHLETAGIVSKRDGDDLSSRPCLLCPQDGGALKTVRMDPSLSPSDDAAKFVHLFCSLWTPDVYVKDTWAMELVTNMGGIQDKHRRLVCNVCKVKHGLCIKCSHDMGGVKDTKNLLLAIDDKKLVPKLSSAILPTKKLPTLQFTPNKRDQNMMQNEIANLNSEKIVQMKPDEQEALVDRLDSDGGQAGTIAEMDTDGAIFFVQLIDQGKINADDIASEMGISLDSLQAALIVCVKCIFVHLLMLWKTHLKLKILSLQIQIKGRKLTEIVNSDLSDADNRANGIEEKVPFLHYEGNRAVDTNTMTQDTMQSGYSKYYDGEVDVVPCTKSYLE
ncbi:hypothetical protein GW17_00003639 [Ensete ventricosum]|nr:hypothetical protein GW17_00003639 [Ensete ventricosum]